MTERDNSSSSQLSIFGAASPSYNVVQTDDHSHRQEGTKAARQQGRNTSNEERRPSAPRLDSSSTTPDAASLSARIRAGLPASLNSSALADLEFEFEYAMATKTLLRADIAPSGVPLKTGRWIVHADDRYRYFTGRTREPIPAGSVAGVPWAGLHTLRHTAATHLFSRGANAVQVQRFLGHHSPAFTLAVYVHLLPDDLPDTEFLDVFAPAVAVPATGSSDNALTAAQA